MCVDIPIYHSLWSVCLIVAFLCCFKNCDHTVVSIYILYLNIDVYIQTCFVCIVQHFQQQGRCSTNILYCCYLFFFFRNQSLVCIIFHQTFQGATPRWHKQVLGCCNRWWGGGGGGRGGRYSILIIAGPDEQVTITKVLTASLSFIFTRWAVIFWVADTLNVNAATTYWTRPLVRKARIMTCKRKTNLISVNRLIIKELLVCPLICFLLLLWSNFLHLKKTIVVKSVHVLLFPCVSSHWWVHFPRSVLFWLSKSQDYRTVIM